LESLGYIGALLLAVCAVPQMIMCMIDGHAKGISHLFLLSWYFGEILMLIFCYDTVAHDSPLFVNYAVNVAILTIIAKYKYFPRRL